MSAADQRYLGAKTLKAEKEEKLKEEKSEEEKVKVKKPKEQRLLADDQCGPEAV